LVCYPNPFSGSANIELQLENESAVSAFVVNMAGNKVASLQEGKLTEGKHRFVFDGSALPKGVYLVKVITSNAQQTVKLISK